MHRKTAIVALVVMALVVVAAAQAEAHYQPKDGKLVWHSVNCVEDLTGVRNPATNPAIVRCTVIVTKADTLCLNPTYHDPSPGESVTQTIPVVGEDQVTSGDITGKGKATVTVEDVVPNCPVCDPTDPSFTTCVDAIEGSACVLGLTNAQCVSANWHIIDALVREATVVLETFACVDANKDGECTTDPNEFTLKASSLTTDCVLPASVDFSTVPPPEGIPYDCTTPSVLHLK